MHRLTLWHGCSDLHGLEANVVDALRENGIKTVVDFICCDVDKVAQKIPFSVKDLQFLKTSLVARLSPLIVNGSDLYEEMMSRFYIFSTGCDHLDDLLDGGVYTGEITEFVGAAGVGKSQVCMSIALFTAKQAKKNILYVDTGGSLSGHRMKEMLLKWDSSLKDEEVLNVLSRISVVQAFDVHSVFDALESVRETLSNEEDDSGYRQLKMIIVDSVAAVIGPILGGQQILGHSLMVNLSRTLKSLAVDHSMAVVITNNVVSDAKSSSFTKPALGPTWAHVPNTRVFIQKSRSSHQPGRASETSEERICTVTKSSRQREQVSTALFIERGGLCSRKSIASQERKAR